MLAHSHSAAKRHRNVTFECGSSEPNAGEIKSVKILESTLYVLLGRGDSVLANYCPKCSEIKSGFMRRFSQICTLLAHGLAPEVLPVRLPGVMSESRGSVRCH